MNSNIIHINYKLNIKNMNKNKHNQCSSQPYDAHDAKNS